MWMKRKCSFVLFVKKNIKKYKKNKKKLNRSMEFPTRNYLAIANFWNKYVNSNIHILNFFAVFSGQMQHGSTRDT
jgi:hypothetical protein